MCSRFRKAWDHIAFLRPIGFPRGGGTLQRLSSSFRPLYPRQRGPLERHHTLRLRLITIPTAVFPEATARLFGGNAGPGKTGSKFTRQFSGLRGAEHQGTVAAGLGGRKSFPPTCRLGRRRPGARTGLVSAGGSLPRRGTRTRVPKASSRKVGRRSSSSAGKRQNPKKHLKTGPGLVKSRVRSPVFPNPFSSGAGGPTLGRYGGPTVLPPASR